MTRRELIALATVSPFAFAEDAESILGTGWGLDHIEIAVSSGEAAKETYFQNLGFSMPTGASAAVGVQHSGVFFVPTYLEFLWFDGTPVANPNLPVIEKLRQAVDQHRGIFQYNIDVSNIESLRDRLSAKGLNVSLAPSTRIANGKEEPAPWRFLYATDNRTGKAPLPGVPGGDAVGLIEYRENNSAQTDAIRRMILSSVPDPRRAAGEDNANTARRLRSVWVAVPDVADALKKSTLFGLTSVGNIRSSALRAKGERVECGQGSIEFWEPERKDGALATLLSERGPGPFGFSVIVANLDKAHQIAAKGFDEKFATENRDGHRTFAVSAKLTDGVWVEFVQQ